MRRDRIRNEVIFNILNIRIGIIDRIRNRRLRYFGHLNRLKNERYPQNSIQRLCTWNQKEGKTKEKMDRRDQRGLQRTESDTSGSSGGHVQDAGQESVESNHRRAADACSGIIAWAITEKEEA